MINRRLQIIKIKINKIHFYLILLCYFQMAGGVHELNEINASTHLHIISHKMNKEYKQTVEIIKMKMFAIV